MSRTVEFLEDKFILHLKGVTSLAALKRRVEVPYDKIRSVSAGAFHVSPMHFKVGTSGFTENLKEGRFDDASGWMFLSYKSHEQVVIVELVDHDFTRLVFEAEHPEEMRDLIMGHLKQ